MISGTGWATDIDRSARASQVFDEVQMEAHQSEESNLPFLFGKNKRDRGNYKPER
jgi:hypothetical protein